MTDFAGVKDGIEVPGLEELGAVPRRVGGGAMLLFESIVKEFIRSSVKWKFYILDAVQKSQQRDESD